MGTACGAAGRRAVFLDLAFFSERYLRGLVGALKRATVGRGSGDGWSSWGLSTAGDVAGGGTVHVLMVFLI